jgi:nucleoid-associated protein YgaU
MKGPPQGKGTIAVLVGAAVLIVVALAAGLGFDPRTVLAPFEPVRAPPPAPQASAPSPQAPGDVKPQSAEGPRSDPAAVPQPAQRPEAPAPSFDVVRVEPNGESVIAGRGVAGATIEMLRDGQIHARAAADQSGLFAFVPPPLQPGSHQVTLQSIAPDGTRQRSRDSVTIVVAEGGNTRPLVALTSPDRPTVLLSNPEAPEPKGAEAKTAEGKTAEPKTAEATAAETKIAEAKKAEAEVGSANSKNAESTNTESKPTEPKPAEPKAAQDGSEPQQRAAAPAGAPSPPPRAEGSQDASRPGGPPPPRPEVKIATVEAEEGGRLYVSGQAAPGSTVRLYLNETFIAPGGAGADGKVSFAIGRGVRPGDYRVRIDDVDPVSGAVKSRAEVTFNVPPPVATALQQPPGAAPSGRGPQVAAAPQAPQVPPTERQSERPVGPSSSPAQTSHGAPSASSGPEGAAGQAPAGGASPASPTVAGAPASRPEAAPGAPRTSGSQVASASVPEPRDLPPGTIVVPDITTAIVSRGDNLWRISQRIYGKGVRYTVIYGANQRQIRNPNLIYPGQVFVVPESQGPKER